MEEILDAWERDAKQILPSHAFSPDERRDHAKAIIEGMATEMAEPQTASEQSAKAKGWHEPPPEKTGAQRHGSQRMTGGMGVIHVATEFRALRLSVIKLWTLNKTEVDQTDFKDLIRFNQAVDQALAESIESFTVEKEKKGRLFDTTLLSVPDPSYVLDLSGRFIYANKATTELFNTPLYDLTGKTITELGLPIQENLDLEIEHVIREKIQVRGEMTLSDPTGDARYYEYTFAPVLDEREQTEAIIGTVRDITERRESEAKIWRQANHDLLTGLPNRRLFQDRLKQHTEHAKRAGLALALLFIDLDRFKEINDRLGHDAGDLLLQQAADRIFRCVRETDTIARLSGDEFTVILLDIDNPDQIDQIARDILAELEQPFHLEGDRGYISASIGIARYPHDAQTFQELVKNADRAMYTAKESGRNQFCHVAHIADRGNGRAKLAKELNEALARQEFQLYYQPVVDLDKNRIAKAEALLRWAHPARGLLVPADFIDLAEETGLIREIENWVFAQAVKSAKQWRDRGSPGFQIMLNLSPVQFCQRMPDVAWSSQLEQVGLDGHGLVVELTEKVFSQNEERLARSLTKLEEAGIMVALDDYGAGQSSMACLMNFNFDFLKIASSFVHSYEVDKSGQAIAEATIAMAHRLGLKVIAEGVETQAQKEWLQAAGCDHAQGFLFSRPLPILEFRELLESQGL